MRIGLNLFNFLPGVIEGTETYAAGLLVGWAQVDSENKYFVSVYQEVVGLVSINDFKR